MRGQWGVMLHYLYHGSSGEEWNAYVEAFDVDALVQSLRQSGAYYLLFTVGQNSGYFCAPNRTYQDLTGRNSGQLTRRDLIGDLAASCRAAGMRCLAYVPAHGPEDDDQAVAGLGFPPGRRAGDAPASGGLLEDAQRNWRAVLAKWSNQWGESVSGWWVDGAYYYRAGDPPVDHLDYQAFASALRAGNPEAAIAFNSAGVTIPIVSLSGCEDYTAGEVNALPTHNSYHPVGDSFPGPMYHVLSYLGQFWGAGAPRYSDELAIAYTRYLTGRGAAITWDVPITLEGRVPHEYLRQLEAIGRA